jgi:hypothetical protein
VPPFDIFWFGFCFPGDSSQVQENVKKKLSFYYYLEGYYFNLFWIGFSFFYSNVIQRLLFVMVLFFIFFSDFKHFASISPRFCRHFLLHNFRFEFSPIHRFWRLLFNPNSIVGSPDEELWRVLSIWLVFVLFLLCGSL